MISQKYLAWLGIIALTVQNTGFACGWLFFNPIPYQTAAYFSTDLNTIDNLLIITTIVAVFGQLISLLLADKYGPKSAMILSLKSG